MIQWIPGTLELTSKVRYALSTRGVPSFRFIPYDKSLTPFAVGSSIRDLSKNISCLVEPSPSNPKKEGELAKANFIRILEKELDVLLWVYAFNSKKHLRNEFPLDINSPFTNTNTNTNTNSRVEVKEGFTFHIDPPGCKDVDDSFTFLKLETGWKIWIHIADVASWIPEGSELDKNAFERSTSFYSLEGEALVPMLPRLLSEEKASVNKSTPTLSLSFLWTPGSFPTDFEWQETLVTTPITSFTYDQADQQKENCNELQALSSLTIDLKGGIESDSHSWVQQLMILYNSNAGKLLRKHNLGVLRKHSEVKQEKLETLKEVLQIDPSLQILAFESAINCLAPDPSPSHFGLQQEFYAYASSPLRRYTDLVNQRCLKHILFNIPITQIPDQCLIDHLNKRQKQAKQFSRDLFFSIQLQNYTCVKGIVLSDSMQVLIPSWKRIIKLKTPSERKGECELKWYCDPSKPRWKDRIVFSLK